VAARVLIPGIDQHRFLRPQSLGRFPESVTPTSEVHPSLVRSLTDKYGDSTVKAVRILSPDRILCWLFAVLNGGGLRSLRWRERSIASAIFDATGARLRALPFTPERVWRAVKG